MVYRGKVHLHVPMRRPVTVHNSIRCIKWPNRHNPDANVHTAFGKNIACMAGLADCDHRRNSGNEEVDRTSTYRDKKSPGRASGFSVQLLIWIHRCREGFDRGRTTTSSFSRRWFLPRVRRLPFQIYIRNQRAPSPEPKAW
jgi:hypothetical protein